MWNNGGKGGGPNPGVQSQPSWSQTWPAAAPSLNPNIDPVFNPSTDPVFNPSSSNMNFDDINFDIAGSVEEFSVDDDPVFMADMAATSAPYQTNPGVFGAPLGARLGGIPSASFPSSTTPTGGSLHTTPTGGNVQADLLNGNDPWAAPQSEAIHDSFPVSGPGGSKLLPTIGSAVNGGMWGCEQCNFQNHLSATRCQACGWDRKAALKLRMRQDLMAKMASNGSIPGSIA